MLSASITSMSRAYSTASVNTQLDRLQLLRGVETFNLHPHLPHLERVGAAAAKLDVVARQKIDLTAPPHPFTRDRKTFDAFLQSRPDTFEGSLYVSDTTLWSSTAGGIDSLRQFWQCGAASPSMIIRDNNPALA
jgi:hypothetical protein